MKIKEILKGVIYGNDYIMPLRKELLYILILSPFFISFCSAGTYVRTGTLNNGLATDYFYISIPQSQYSCDVSYTCTLSNIYTENGSQQFSFQPYQYYARVASTQSLYNNYIGGYNINVGAGRLSYSGSYGPSYASDCLSAMVLNVKIMSQSVVSFDYSCEFTGPYVFGNVSCPTCPTCPSQYTSEECQSEYDLVPSSNLTTCNNNLSNCQNSLSGYDTLLNNCSTNLNSCNSSLSSCLQLNCPVSSGGVSWSSLFINDIQHIGAPTINISIPSEIQWDYLNENDEFNLTVDGYNTDPDYIEGVINIQNSKPSKEDLNNIISRVIPLFVPGLVIIMFVYFVFKFIKKIF